MAEVFVCNKITDPECAAKARTAGQAWEQRLARAGISGKFLLSHGAYLSCMEAHDHCSKYVRGLYIHDGLEGDMQRRLIFRTRPGNPQWYAGHTRHAERNVLMDDAATK